MAKDTRKVCFVVMGFGTKTDYESGRTLDLDAAYDAIILPAATDQNLRCIRADEIMHSGIIDTEMYEMLLRADLVIADISTGNVNAIYELGVRHALRPNSTIIMKEGAGRLYFDLNHLSTFQYEHLGNDIGSREAVRARRSLGTLISEVMSAQKPDSPVYTYLPKLQQPKMTDAEYAELLDDAEAAQKDFSALLSSGESAMKESRHADAAVIYEKVLTIKPNESFFVQQLALATYKSNVPSKLDSLMKGLTIISALDPENSNDPETLGIAGAIRKRLWLMTSDRVQLDCAIRLYGRGFEVRRDYYNGENLATCFEMRSKIQTEGDEIQFDQMSARKVREVLLILLQEITSAQTFPDRSDKKWIFATLANCAFALGKHTEGNEFEKSFYAEAPADWEINTYTEGKIAISYPVDKIS
ncbi:TRAFs-binding domain-containing protein [Undibacterium sp. Ji42W]|uniref:TRAFs-binding domain-containing protein n=1 Tax=Undibacterium sp. Ji42W TaxID=3413039 RepID=UPI003BF2B217